MPRQCPTSTQTHNTKPVLVHSQQKYLVSSWSIMNALLGHLYIEVKECNMGIERFMKPLLKIACKVARLRDFVANMRNQCNKHLLSTELGRQSTTKMTSI